MNVELYEGQKGRIRITLNGEFEVYGGTTKERFVSGRHGDDYILIIPAQYNTSCYDPRFDIFARRESTGQEWLVESGRIMLKQRHSSAQADAVSSMEYHITKELLESGETVESKPMVIGIKGDRGYSAYDIAVQNGYVGTEQEFTTMMTMVRTYHDEAAESQRKSAASESSAKNYASTASNAADKATSEATKASKAATDAENSLNEARTEANSASSSAKDAETHERNAETHATDAADSRDSAQKHASDAANSKDEAGERAEIAQKAMDAACDAQITSEINAIICLRATQDIAEAALNTI